MLEDIITSVARQKILRYFYKKGIDCLPFVREISRDTKLEVNAVRRELQRLSKAGFFIEESRSNRIHYKLNQKHHLFYALGDIINRETGLAKKFLLKRKKLGSIKYLFFSLNFVLKSKTRSKVDIVIVGDVYLEPIEQIITKFERENNMEVNYMILKEEEFNLLKQRKDSTILEALLQPISIVIGEKNKVYNLD